MNDWMYLSLKETEVPANLKTHLVMGLKKKERTITLKEFQAVMDDIFERYPQVKLFLKNKQMRGIADLLEESKGDVEKESIEITIEELKTALFNLVTDEISSCYSSVSPQR
ncbi:external alternative NAD(P)H-ubiquinone oxidoreductase B2, mitochondrial-like [Vicia villosa]|uniref:external alternative NAD(P)H-ubiquinone oxidoreductase B2, mitochondrial-like n=1 Tax=Vicia villosa TaxID=3911 RepID=UPI00273CCDF5|nr:external alternative NAD(P)H-ubiquinone oxidoreductase B2, mitochondrial-like [Vicia villosa]